MSSLLALLLSATPASALERLAVDVSRQVVGARLEPPVGLYVAGAAPLRAPFASLLAAQLASARLAPVVIEAREGGEAERLGRSLGTRSLLRLSVLAEGTTLAVRGDGLSTWVNFWSGRTPTRAGPALVVAAAAEVDAESRLLLGRSGPGLDPPLPIRPRLALSTLVALDGLPLAVAAGDLDGDGQSEIFCLVGETVVVYTSLGRRIATFDLSTGPPAAEPAREPFGALAFLALPARVVAWSARRAKVETLEWQRGALRQTAQSETLTLAGLTLRHEAGFNRFTVDVSWGDPSTPFRLPLGLHAVSARGPVTLLLAPDGRAAVARGAAPTGWLVGVGTGSTLFDPDGDGAPDVLVSSATTTGNTDELRLLSLAAFEALQVRGGQSGSSGAAAAGAAVLDASSAAELSALWESPAKGRVMTATAADLDGDGREEALLGAWFSDGKGALLVLAAAELP
jgi:hypothetical protein